MRRFFILLCISGCTLLQAARLPLYDQYIEQYRAIAIEQQQKHKIPASITLAQGILESGAGQSELAKKAHNHFGIKCTSDWSGATFRHDDDRRQECFRKYRYASESYEDHSKFLLRDRYKTLFDLPLSDYKGWAHGLSRCGYATDPKYPEKLIRIIEEYGLDKLSGDAGATHRQPQKEQEQEPIYAADTVEVVEEVDFQERVKQENLPLYHDHRSGKQNHTRYVIAEQGETFATMSYYFDMREKTLRRYNDALDGRQLKKGDRVYLYPKPRKAPRKYARYYVRKGDTAWSISQKFGFQMRTIYELNGIKEGTPLTTRQELRLR